MITIEAKNVNCYFGDFHVLKNISFDVDKNNVVALIGPSGCGKSTFLRLFNRMNDHMEGVKIGGEILIDNMNIYDTSVCVEDLRKKVGMVFNMPNPFPKSIFENIAFGLKIKGYRDKAFIENRVVELLEMVSLWNEVKSKLKKPASVLNLGQQQRLCLARALSVEPEILLMDEPSAMLDPISTAKIEEIIHELKPFYTIVIVTHSMHQAARISDKTAFFNLGELVEFDTTTTIFTNPKNLITQNYITGRYG
jgi:phosphate transport system ATP-binding protein